MCFFLTGCHNKNILIQNIVKDTIYKIQTNANSPSNLRFRVKGFTDDTCIINKSKVEKGKIDTLLQSDWYESIIIIDYKAYKAKSGNIVISYEL